MKINSSIKKYSFNTSTAKAEPNLEYVKIFTCHAYNIYVHLNDTVPHLLGHPSKCQDKMFLY